MQKLVLPINNCKLTATYKNPAYLKKFGFVHYGTDMISTVGNKIIYASGNGTVVSAGTDSVVGKIVIIKYPMAYNHQTLEYKDLLIRYFHLDQIKTSVGANVTKDSVIGIYGNTGSLIMGKHLHIEVDKDTKYPLYSPTVASSSLLKGRYFGANDSTMTDPIQWLHAKTSAPDHQVFSTTNDSYINSNDKFLPKLV